jgi:hypothetical protein
MIRTEIGSVVEFRFPEYLVYGVCIDEDSQSGDTLAMYARKFILPISGVADLTGEPVRYKILFVVKSARARRNADILRIAGKMQLDELPKLDNRFRSNMSVIASVPCWHIVENKERTSVPFLTKETALLSNYGIPNMEMIKYVYDRDLYPWSAELLNRGPLDFDAETFEREMRLKLQLN